MAEYLHLRIHLRDALGFNCIRILRYFDFQVTFGPFKSKFGGPGEGGKLAQIRAKMARNDQ